MSTNISAANALTPPAASSLENARQTNLLPIPPRLKVLFFITEDYYFCSHRLELAVAAQTAGYEVRVVTRLRAHAQVIRDAGITAIPFENERTGVNPFIELVTLLRLIRIYRRERPDVVHHVALKPVLYGSIAARFAGSPRIVNAVAGMGSLFSSHEGPFGWLKPLVRWSLGWLLKRGTALVQNPDDARILREQGVPGKNISMIRGAGVNLERFVPTPEASGIPQVLFPARLLWEKGLGELVAAARLLRDQGVMARFVLAGEFDFAKASCVSPAQVAEWSSEGLVKHLGFVPDMAALLCETHIVCLPSYYGEGIPKSLIEAAAAGRPIVTTDMPGCREIVHHEDNGLLVPPRDSIALAAALARLINDPALRSALGARGRIRAEREFGLVEVIRKTLELYRENENDPQGRN